MPAGNHPVIEPIDRRRVHGVDGSPSQRRRHTLMLCFFFAVALIQVSSAVWFLFERQLAGRSDPFPLWVQLVLLIAIVEFCFAISMTRVVDHGVLWVLSLLSLGVAMIYAFILALLLFGRFGIVLTSLELAGDVPHRGGLWICLVVVSSQGLFAWVAGRTSFHWHAELTRKWLGRI